MIGARVITAELINSDESDLRDQRRISLLVVVAVVLYRLVPPRSFLRSALVDRFSVGDD